MIEEINSSKKEFIQVISIITKKFPKLGYSCNFRVGSGKSILTITFRLKGLEMQEQEKIKETIESLGYNLYSSSYKNYDLLSIQISTLFNIL